MSENRFKITEFRAAIEEVAASYLKGKTHIPNDDMLLELAVEGVSAAIETPVESDDYRPARGLEDVPFTEFAKLSVLVPRKSPPGLVDYPLLSDNFLAEPIFQKFPTIAAFRGFLADNDVRSIDDVTLVSVDGVDKRLRYDRRAELIQLIHRTGLDPLPGMHPFVEMGKGSAAWDLKNLGRLLEQVVSAQTRDMLHGLLAEGEKDPTYLLKSTPFTRDQALKHLKTGESEAILDNALVLRNTGPQVAAHLRFLLDFRRIGLRGGKPYLMPLKANGRVRKSPMIDTKL